MVVADDFVHKQTEQHAVCAEKVQHITEQTLHLFDFCVRCVVTAARLSDVGIIAHTRQHGVWIEQCGDERGEEGGKRLRIPVDNGCVKEHDYGVATDTCVRVLLIQSDVLHGPGLSDLRPCRFTLVPQYSDLFDHVSETRATIHIVSLVTVVHRFGLLILQQQ